MSAKIEALSPGGAAWAKAVRGARAYESLRPESVAKRAMAICARAEGVPAPPRSGARFHFCYSEDPKRQAAIAESIAELKALGVEQITCQSREEYEAKRRADHLRAVCAPLPTSIIYMDGAPYLCAFELGIKKARILARELRREARYLAERIRKAEKIAREKWPEYKRLPHPKLKVKE